MRVEARQSATRCLCWYWGSMQLQEVQVPTEATRAGRAWEYRDSPCCLLCSIFLQPTTLPQGTINMNQCTDVVDGEGRTGQKFSLCILTPEKEHFIRAETKEIISG